MIEEEALNRFVSVEREALLKGEPVLNKILVSKRGELYYFPAEYSKEDEYSWHTSTAEVINKMGADWIIFVTEAEARSELFTRPVLLLIYKSKTELTGYYIVFSKDKETGKISIEEEGYLPPGGKFPLLEPYFKS